MQKIRAIIVDDEPYARRGIRNELASEPDIEIVAESPNGKAAVTDIQKLKPDLLFLDVQMPGLDGFGVLDAIADEPLPVIIFVTAYDQYALQAFDYHAVDYLLKPLDTERFQAAIKKARTYIQSKDTTELTQRLVSLLESRRGEQQYVARLAIKSSGRVSILKVEEIDWIEADDNYVQLHVGNHVHMLHETLTCLERKLDPGRFLRIHRSRIVNVERIKELHPLFHGEHILVLQDGTRLASSRNYRDRLFERLEISDH